MSLAQQLKVCIDIFRSEKIELVPDRATGFFQVRIHPLEVSESVLIFFSVFIRWLSQLFIALNFYHEDQIGGFDEEVRAKLAALGMFTLFPSVFDFIEPHCRGF